MSSEEYGFEMAQLSADYEAEISHLRAEVTELKASKELCDNTEAYNIALEEIKELKAEVGRLTSIKLKQVWQYDTRSGEARLIGCQNCLESKRERDEALDALSTVRKDLSCGQHEEYKMVWCIRCIESERTQAQHREQEALAQVAVLLREYVKLLPTQDEQAFLNAPLLLPSWVQAEARALLGRLRRAEAVVEVAKTGKPLAEKLADLIVREDIPDEDLQEAAETLLPTIHDFFLRLNAAMLKVFAEDPMMRSAEFGLTERRATFVYETCRIEAIASCRPIVPEPLTERDEAFYAQFLRTVERLCSDNTAPTTPEAEHDCWVRAYKEMGWVYGPIRDLVRKTHPDMVPFNELPTSEQEKDAVFLSVCGLAKRFIRGV